MLQIINEMNASVDAQTQNERIVIDSCENEFVRLHSRLCKIIEATPVEILYENPRSAAGAADPLSIGENVLRSAAAVEQTFGGITASLWDDPFEWTLPETLSTRERVLEYLGEVEQTRDRAFARFSSDCDLLKEVSVPSGETQPLIGLLVETLVRASEYQGRAAAMLRILSDVRLPGVII